MLDTDFDRVATPQTDDDTFLVGAHHWPNQNATQYHRQARGDGAGWDTAWTGDWTDYEGMQWWCNPGLGTRVTLTYVVTVTAPSRSALWNQAILTRTGSLTGTATATTLVLVDPLRVYLPLIFRE